MLMDANETFADWILRCRKELNISRKKFANMLGVKLHYYNQYETNKTKRFQSKRNLVEKIERIFVKENKKMPDFFANESDTRKKYLSLLAKRLDSLLEKQIKELAWYIQMNRESAGLEVWELAKLLHTSEIRIIDYELGERFPKDKTFLKRFNRVIKKEIVRKRGERPGPDGKRIPRC